MAGWWALVKVQIGDQIKTIAVALDNAYSLTREEALKTILEKMVPGAVKRLGKVMYGSTTTKWKLIEVVKMERWTDAEDSREFFVGRKERYVI